MPMGMLCRVRLVAAETKKPPGGGKHLCNEKKSVNK